jgi:hypothetical protein
MIRMMGLGAALVAAAGLACAAAAAPGKTVAAAEAGEAAAGPWRQLIRYQPREGRDSGISLWVDEASIVPAGAEPPMRTRSPREAWELWINHGAGIVAGQRYRIVRTRHNCGESDMVRLGEAAYAADGTQLAAAAGDGARIPVIPHSAETVVRQAVCDDGTVARRRRTAATVAEAVSADPAGPEPAQPRTTLSLDLDADGRPEPLRVAILSPSMRVDIAGVPGAGPTGPASITVERRPTGQSLDARLRPVPPGSYVYACARQDGRDLDPCRPGSALVVRGGVELVTPGGPSLLLWVPDREPRVVRLPELPPVELPFPMPNTHLDRPLMPSLGSYYPGRLGEGCDSGTLPDGRRSRDQLLDLGDVQAIGISVASPDFAPTLQLFREGRPEQPLLALAAAADGRRAAARFDVPEPGDYVVRLIAPKGATEGRWRSELTFDRPLEEVYRDEMPDFAGAAYACQQAPRD